MGGATAMNHYEEFGVFASALVEEVQQAYRELARLRDPDRRRDERVAVLSGRDGPGNLRFHLRRTGQQHGVQCLR